MKRRLAILCCLGTILSCGSSRAQQPAIEQPAYVLDFVGIADTSQVIWFIDQEGPKTNSAPTGIVHLVTGNVYKFLDSPSLSSGLISCRREQRCDTFPHPCLNSVLRLRTIAIPKRAYVPSAFSAGAKA